MSAPIVTGVRSAFHKRRLAVVGIAGVLVVSSFSLASSAVTAVGDQSGSFHIYADLTDAGALITGNDVRLHGVKVGTVKAITVVNGQARLDLALSGSARPLHRDMTVTVRPVSLLGERYVDISAGTASAPVIGNKAEIPASQTSRSVDLDEVLDTVDKPTGDALSAALTSLGEGVTGQGANGAATIKALTPATQQMDALLKVLDTQNSVLTQLIDDAKPVLAGVDANQGATLDGLVSSTGQLLATTNAQQANLESTLEALPKTLADARTTLQQLSGVADSTTPVLASIRPTTDNLTAISSELSSFSDAATPALATLQPVLAKAQGLIDQARPLVNQLVQAGPAMTQDAKDANEFLTTLDNHLSGVLGFIRNWSLTTNGSDGLSHYFRAVITVHQQYVTQQLPAGVTVPTTAATTPKAASTGAAPAAPAAGVGKAVAPAVGTVTSTLGAVTSGVGTTLNQVTGAVAPAVASLTGSTPKTGSATGLTSTQEGNLLGMLMGSGQ